jgi:hypothetical protein
VVTTFHISTMTINQRSALAKSWLADSKTPEEPGQEADAAAADAASDADDNSDGSGSDSSEAGSPPDLLETWIIMEFCERGSLERALKLCKFKARDGLPEMVGTTPCRACSLWTCFEGINGYLAMYCRMSPLLGQYACNLLPHALLASYSTDHADPGENCMFAMTYNRQSL